MKTQYPTSDSLQSYINIFKDQLTKPQLNHFSSLIIGTLHGYGKIRKIVDLFSNKNQSSLTRFMLSRAWDHESKLKFMKLCTWVLIVWSIHKASEGESLINIRLKLAL